MSKFKKTLVAVAELGAKVGDLEATLGAATDGVAELEQARRLLEEANGLAPGIAKSVRIAKETDEDKKLYGPKMVAQVLELDAAFSLVKSRLEEATRAAEGRANPLLEKQRAEAEARAGEERRQREEAEAAERARTAQAEEARVMREQERREEQEREAREAEERAQRERAEYEAELAGQSARQNNTTTAQYKRAVKIIAHIMTTVAEAPENEALRQIRIKNESFQEDIARHIGGEECLYALGFRQTELTKAGSKVHHSPPSSEALTDTVLPRPGVVLVPGRTSNGRPRCLDGPRPTLPQSRPKHQHHKHAHLISRIGSII